jgi:hypothetical protein
LSITLRLDLLAAAEDSLLVAESSIGKGLVEQDLGLLLGSPDGLWVQDGSQGLHLRVVLLLSGSIGTVLVTATVVRHDDLWKMIVECSCKDECRLRDER